MSRSRKKQPFYSANPGSMKVWKKEINRQYRAFCRQKLYKAPTDDWESLILPTLKQMTSIWDSPKDGYSNYQQKPKPSHCICYRYYWIKPKYDVDGNLTVHARYCYHSGYYEIRYRKVFRK